MRSVEQATTKADTPARRPSIAPHWYHFLGLTTLAVAVDLLAAMAGIQGGEPEMGWMKALELGLGQVSGDLFAILPVTAAVAAGLIRDATTVARSGLKLGMVAVAVLLAADLSSDDAVTYGQPRLAVQGGEAVFSSGTDIGSVSAIRTLVAFVRGDLPGADEVLQRYPLDHPRLVLTTAFLKLPLLLSPLVLIGFVTGCATWLSSRVIFLRSSDEVVARIVLSWLLAPFVYGGIWSWTSDARTEVLFRGGRLSLILVPLVPFAMVSLVGWYAARSRLSQAVEPAEEAE